MEKKIDIIPFLQGIVEENTHHYQSDFAYDEQRLQAAMLEVNQEDRTLLWMSRPCGTWCFLERDIFLRDTQAHIVWTNEDYIAEASQIKAYRIIVAPGYPGAFVLGKIQPLNYGEQVQRVKKNAIHIHAVELTFKDGETRAMSYGDYPKRVSSLVSKHGNVERIHYKPEDEAELTGILKAERMIPAVKKRSPRKKKSATR